MHLNDRDTLDYAFQITQKKTELVGDSLHVFSWEIHHPEWSAISFEDCTDTNDAAEQTAIHMRNIQSALRIFGLLQAAKEDAETYVNELKTLKELQHLISVVTKQNPRTIRIWLAFLYKQHKQPTDTETTLQAMKRLSSIFQTHVAICRAFSQGRKQLFYCKHRPDYSKPEFDKVCAFGICRDKIGTENARIVIIYGLYMPFLMRFREDRPEYIRDSTPVVAATLLSPVLFAGSLGYEETQSGRLRFMAWECGSEARKIFLRLE
ncbi:hypothetical protein V8F33_011416 [Rhypophila sp. PSN 637]